MSNKITSTDEMAEREWDGQSEYPDGTPRIVATKEAEGRGMEFHVSLRDYTLHDMEDLIVEAAAKLIVGRHNDSALAKAIEAKCIALVDEKATAALESVATGIIDQPLTPEWGEKKPVTMREFIGLYGREYLEGRVDREGKPSKSGWGNSTYSRIEWLVLRQLDSRFKQEIEKATNSVILEVKKGVEARHQETLAAEKKRLLDAVNKMGGG